LVDEQKWKLQEQVSFLEGQVKESTGTIVKLKAENLQKAKEIDALVSAAEKREEPLTKMHLFRQRDRGSRQSLSLSVENKSIVSLDDLAISPIRENPPISPLRDSDYMNESKSSLVIPGTAQILFRECELCTHAKQRLEDLANEKEEIQQLLDRSYEAFERLQSDSMLSAGNVSIIDSIMQQELDSLKKEYQRACDEKFELEELLYQSREAFEQLQNESMLSSADALADQVKELQLKLEQTIEEKKTLQHQLETLQGVPSEPLVTTVKVNIATVPNGSIVQHQVADVQNHAIQAKELLEGTRNEILEAQSSISAAISDLVVQYQNAIKTPGSVQATPKKRIKESRSVSAEALVEAYEMRNQSHVFRRRPFATPVLGVSPSNSTFTLDEAKTTPRQSKPRTILNELQTLGMPSASRYKSVSSQNNSNSIGALTYTMIGSYVC
jgi:hypothetical protein